MRKKGRLIRWISISVILQVALLSYINFIYLPNRGNVTVSKFSFAEDNISDKTVKLTDGANGISVSFNGLFAAYKKDDKIEIYDIKAKKVIKTLIVKAGELSYYRWLLDRDILIYSVKEPGGKNGQVQLCTYDLGSKTERSYPKLTGLPADSEVTDIEVSALTNIVYFMVKTSDTRTKIYKYNIMDKLKFVMNANVKTVIKETSYEDYMVYSDTNDNLYIRNGNNSKKEQISFKQNLRLLAIDSEDNIYAGALDDDGNVESIFVGKADLAEKEWKTVELKNPAAPQDIFIPDGGRIFIADRQNSRVNEAESSVSFSYKGELLDVLDDYHVTTEGRKLSLTAIEK